MPSNRGKIKALVGDCWTITFETVSQRAIGRPDNVFTWGGVTGSWDELTEAIEAMGGTIEQIVTYNSSGLEIADVRDVEICLPCEAFDTPPSDTLAWSFLNGSRTSTWSKKWCDNPQSQQFCFETCTVEAFLDNQTNGEPPWGAMMWPFRNWRVEIKMSDGSTCVVDHPKTINQGEPLDWRNNIEVFAASLAAKTGKPWQRKSAPLDGDPATPVANHSGATCCCSDPLPVSALGYRVNDDGTDEIDPKTGQPFQPTPFLTGVWKKEITKVWLCRDCDGNEEWRADNPDGEPGEVIEKPELCLYPCGQVPELPEPEDTDCEVTIIPACEAQPGDPATVVTSGIFLNYIICGTAVSLDSAVTFPDGPSENPAEHVLTDGNFYGDCDTLEQIESPTVEVEEDPIEQFKVVKGPEGDTDSAFQLTIGRPDNSTTWSLENADGVIAAGNDFESFNAALVAAGYTTFIAGPSNEAHYVCPCPEPTARLTIGGTATTFGCTAIADIENVPQDFEKPEADCALRTIGCNDDRRDDVLSDILDASLPKPQVIGPVNNCDVNDDVIDSGLWVKFSFCPDKTEVFSDQDLTTIYGGEIQFLCNEDGSQVSTPEEDPTLVCKSENTGSSGFPIPDITVSAIKIGVNGDDSTVAVGTGDLTGDAAADCAAIAAALNSSPNATVQAAQPWTCTGGTLETADTSITSVDYFLSGGGYNSIPREDASEPLKANRTIGCNDDRRDDKLCEIAKSLDCPECPEAEPTATVSSEDNATVNFPTTATGEFKDHSTTVTLTDPTGCLAANPEAQISVRYKVDHEAGPHDTHRAYILVASSGIFTSQSVSNSAGTTGASNIQIGYATGDPIANARNERWVKLTATAADWLAGVTFTTGFFGGVGGAFESIFSQEFEACDDIGTICPECGDATEEQVERIEALQIEISEKDIAGIANKIDPEEFNKKLGEIKENNTDVNTWFKASRTEAK